MIFVGCCGVVLPSRYRFMPSCGVVSFAFFPVCFAIKNKNCTICFCVKLYFTHPPCMQAQESTHVLSQPYTFLALLGHILSWLLLLLSVADLLKFFFCKGLHAFHPGPLAYFDRMIKWGTREGSEGARQWDLAC